MDKLKPCPFCGKEVRFNHNAELVPDGIYCPNCHMLVRFTRIRVSNSERIGVTMDKIADQWNRRAT